VKSKHSIRDQVIAAIAPEVARVAVRIIVYAAAAALLGASGVSVVPEILLV
jgi:hypothetical protein